MRRERNLFDWYKKVVFDHYADFSGRARRSEYWYFVLANGLINLVFNVLSVGFGGVASASDGLPVGYLAIVLLSLLYSLLVLIPSLAVTVRRLHDTGRSGWTLLWNLLPLIGTIVVIVFLASDSEPGGNRYGPNPRGGGGDDDDPLGHFGSGA